MPPRPSEKVMLCKVDADQADSLRAHKSSETDRNVRRVACVGQRICDVPCHAAELSQVKSHDMRVGYAQIQLRKKRSRARPRHMGEPIAVKLSSAVQHNEISRIKKPPDVVHANGYELIMLGEAAQRVSTAANYN